MSLEDDELWLWYRENRIHLDVPGYTHVNIVPKEYAKQMKACRSPAECEAVMRKIELDIREKIRRKKLQ